MNGYTISDMDGDYSADPSDYFYLADSERFEGQALVKKQHAWRVSSGRIVFAPRVLKSDPSMADLRRLARVVKP